MTIDTLWLQSSDGFAREQLKAQEGAAKLGYLCGWGNPETTLGKVPVGDVDYCEDWLGYSPVPDFYPEFLKDWLRRSIVPAIGGRICPFHTTRFMKSALKYKHWPAKIINRGEMIPPGIVMMSEVVEFTQEWRYYVADGCVLATGWYSGPDENEPAPDLSIAWPKGFCGAVDFGRLADGRIALVESQHPYACGNYTDDSAAWVMWLMEGWKYMLELRQ